MGDSYVEQLVKKSPTLGQTALRAGAVAASIVVLYVLMVLIGIISLVGAFALGYGVYYLFLMTEVEYEYVFVNGELTVDTIYGRNKRKTSGVYDLKKCELIAPVDSTYAAGHHRNTQMKSMDFTSGTGEEGIYIIVIGYGAGNAKVYFEPKPEMISAIKSSVPGKIKEY